MTGAGTASDAEVELRLYFPAGGLELLIFCTSGVGMHYIDFYVQAVQRKLSTCTNDAGSVKVWHLRHK